jgi:hypothetical protein
MYLEWAADAFHSLDAARMVAKRRLWTVETEDAKAAKLLLDDERNKRRKVEIKLRSLEAKLAEVNPLPWVDRHLFGSPTRRTPEE